MNVFLAALVLSGCAPGEAVSPLVASLSAPGWLLFGMALVGVVIGAQSRYRHHHRDGGSERAPQTGQTK